MDIPCTCRARSKSSADFQFRAKPGFCREERGCEFLFHSMSLIYSSDTPASGGSYRVVSRLPPGQDGISRRMSRFALHQTGCAVLTGIAPCCATGNLLRRSGHSWSLFEDTSAPLPASVTQFHSVSASGAWRCRARLAVTLSNSGRHGGVIVYLVAAASKSVRETLCRAARVKSIVNQAVRKAYETGL